MPSADELLGPDVAAALTRCLESVTGPSTLRELAATSRALDGLPLRERADLLRDALLTDIPGGYEHLAEVVRAASATSPSFTGWMIWPVTSAVAVRAADESNRAALEDALALLAELTGRLSSEFALRTLLRHDLDHALEIIAQWTSSPDEHVRRLASEGTRPYLPWAVRVPPLTAQPGRTLGILDALYRDDSDYVRRSVANHLNDLSRDAPDLVVTTAQKWLDAPAPTTPALVRHGLRTLVKRGHPGALTLLGFAPASVDVDGPHLPQTRVPWGGDMHFTAVLRNTGDEPARLAVDYVVHHRKASGRLTTKVFKLTTAELAPGEQLAVDRRHSFRMISTRTYYSGEQAIALQVNGIATPPVTFELVPADTAPST